MRRFRPLALAAVLAQCGALTLASAAENPWQGRKDVRWLPQHEVPFAQSQWRVNVGTPVLGGCNFPLDSTAPDIPLPPYVRLITVQRAVDDRRCEELLEFGRVVLERNPEARRLGID